MQITKMHYNAFARAFEGLAEVARDDGATVLCRCWAYGPRNLDRQIILRRLSDHAQHNVAAKTQGRR